MTDLLRARDFLGTIGVNVHMEYTDGLYRQTAQVVSDLNYLGISLVRDGIPNVNGGQPFLDQVNALNALAKDGVKFDLFANEPNLANELGQINALAKADPGAIVAVEGANEINNFNFGSYDGLTGEAAAVAFQRDLYAAVHADQALPGVSVYYLTGGSPVNLATATGLADDENGHPYPNDGEVPGARLASSFPQTYLNAAATPQVITETGYFDNPTNPAGGGVSDHVQAVGDVEILLDAAKQGVKATYLYQLLDAYPDNGSNTDAEYGLFNYNGTAKPVAVAIHDLTTILADTGSAASSFATKAATTTLTGLPSTGETMTVEKSDGTQDLVLWNEAPFWNEATHSAITVAASTVTVALGATYKSVEVFDPIAGTAPIATYTDMSSVKLSLAGDPLIVQIGSAVATVSGGSGATVTGGTPSLARNPDGSFVMNGNGSIVTATDGATHISLAYGNQSVLAAGHDTITGGSGADTITATGGALVEFGHGSLTFTNSAVSSTVDGGYGSVTLFGGRGGGEFHAGAAGHSKLVGGAGTASLFAAGDGDTLVGGSGTCTLTGGAGSSTVLAGSGTETLVGGSGVTTMVASTGYELFQLGSAPGSIATVTGFKQGTDHVDARTIGTGWSLADTTSGSVFTLSDGSRLTLLGVHGASAASLLRYL